MDADIGGVWLAGGMGGTDHGCGGHVSRNGRVRTLLHCEHVEEMRGADWLVRAYFVACCLVAHRNKGGQILFLEFCDWAVKQKQLSSQDDLNKKSGFGAVRAINAMTGNDTKASEKNQIIGKHSDYR